MTQTAPTPAPLPPATAPAFLRSASPVPVTLLRVYGEDAFSYLQSQVSADLRVTGERWVRYALWLDAGGHVLADTFILREGAESFLLFSYATDAGQLEQIVLSNVIADDVEVEHLGEAYRHSALWAADGSAAQPLPTDNATAQPLPTDNATAQPLLTGDATAQPLLTGDATAQPLPRDSSAAQPLAAGALPQAGCFLVVDLAEWQAGSPSAGVPEAAGLGAAAARAGDFDSSAGASTALPALLFAGRNAGGENYDLLIPANAPLPAFATALPEVAWAQRECRRIADGIPAIPADIGAGDLPQEGGDLPRAAVSTSKGCYLGQEVIARWHATGQVRSGLFRVRLLAESAAAVPALPARLYAGSKPVGELRSYAVQSGAGLALLRIHRLGEARALAAEAGGEPLFEVIEPMLS